MIYFKLVVAIIALILVVFLIGGFFYTLNQNSKWKCTQYQVITVNWIDSIKEPHNKIQKDFVCLEYRR